MDRTQKRLKSLEKAPMSTKAMDDEDDGGNSDAIDRISNLPNEILCHILSFLPTRTAVATSILSTKWKNLFPLIPNLILKLSDSLLLQPEKSSLDALFMSFVDRLLNVTLRDTPSISTFYLNLSKINDGREIGNWVTSALRLNVKKMDIKNCRLRNSSFLFDSLFECNLVTLNLMLDFIDEAPECWFSLPNLRVLCVQNMKFKVVNVILKGCPLLTELWVSDCYGSLGETLCIRLPSLKALNILNDIYLVEGSRVALDVPNLLYFNCCGYLTNRYVGAKLKFLHLARLDLQQNVGQFTFESIERAKLLMNLCSCAKKFWLSDSFTLMLYNLPVEMPRFRNLMLIVINNFDSCEWRLIPDILDSAPNLETLNVKYGLEHENYELLKAALKKKSFSICLSPHRDIWYAFKIQRLVGN